MTTDVKQKKFRGQKIDYTWGAKLQAKEKRKHNNKTGKFWKD